MRERYGDSVRYVYRHFIVFGDSSVRLSILSECAARMGALSAHGYSNYFDVEADFFELNRVDVDESFWRFHDSLYDDWDEGDANGFGPLWFDKFIEEEFDADIEQVYECASSDMRPGNPVDFVRVAHEDGVSLGVDSTPTVFVNGRKVNGFTEELFQVIDEALGLPGPEATE